LTDFNAMTTMNSLLDVRPRDAFEREHLPGSISNPVVEVGFEDRVPAEWKRDAELVLVGEDETSLEAEMAREKLERIGFSSVAILDGGIRRWLENGNPPEGSREARPRPVERQGRTEVDLDASELQWTGRNLMNRHFGVLQFDRAHLEFDSNRLTGGAFRLDWSTLHCIDLQDAPLHNVLLAHLRDHDFFDVDAYPAPRAVITRVETREHASPGTPDLHLDCELEMKGIRRPVAFDATSGRDAFGRFALQGCFQIDRTEWGVRYGSGQWFKNLGQHLVNDQIEIGLKVVSV